MPVGKPLTSIVYPWVMQVFQLEQLVGKTPGQNPFFYSGHLVLTAW